MGALDTRAPETGDQVGGTQAVLRALGVLACFRDGSPDLGVSDIARALSLKTSTAHRLVRALVREGFLEQDPITSRYRLGNTLAEYGRIVYRQRRVHVAEPYMQELSRFTGENVGLAIRHGPDALALAVAHASSSETIDIAGIRIPLHASAMGKVLLAWADPYESDPAHIGPLTPATARTITSPAELQRELGRVRAAGFALNDEEMVPGIRTVAVPILDGLGHAVFALAVRGPVGHMTDQRIPMIVERAVETAERIRVALLEA